MVSSAYALSGIGIRMPKRDVEERYVRRITMSSDDAVVQDEPEAAIAQHSRSPWLRHSGARLVEFTRLPKDWDLEGGEPVDASAASVAYSLLARLALQIRQAPDLVPVGDGGVMIEWHTRTQDVEIEVQPDFEGSVFLRDRLTNRQFHSTRFRALFDSISRLAPEELPD